MKLFALYVFIIALTVIAVWNDESWNDGAGGSLSSTSAQQIAACIAEAKAGLGDPDSLELVASRGIKLDDGGFRIDLEFTAKNAYGGRVRGSILCGFSNEVSTELDPDDFMNKDRDTKRTFRDFDIDV